MKDRKPILSICVLTYNRRTHLSRILQFLKDEYLSLKNIKDVEIIISDNNSTDRTEQLVKDFIERNNLNEWIYNRNLQNIGLLGNILKTEKLSTGEYLWLWGDDDYYKNGIIRAVIEHIAESPDYILLNHSASKQTPWDGLAFKNALENIDIKKPRIEDIIRKNPGIIMFISACIYRTNLLKKLHMNKYKENIAIPLLYSLYCAASGNYILDSRIWVDDNYKDISWSNQHKQVFYDYIPYYISLMPELGYEYNESQFLLKNLKSNLRKRKIKEWLKYVLKGIHCLNLARQIKYKIK